MKVATRNFGFEYDGERDEAIAGQTRVDDAHELVARFPDCWRDENLTDELQIRTARVAELNDDRDTRVSSYKPLTEMGRRQQREDQFWRSVESTHFADTRSSTERAEQAVFDGALAQLDDFEAARIREETADFREAWQGRLG